MVYLQVFIAGTIVGGPVEGKFRIDPSLYVEHRNHVFLVMGCWVAGMAIIFLLRRRQK